MNGQNYYSNSQVPMWNNYSQPPNGYHPQSINGNGYYRYAPPAGAALHVQQNGVPNGYSRQQDMSNGYSAKPFYGAQNGHQEHMNWNNKAAASDSTEKNLFNRTNSGINFDKYENIPVQVSGDNAPPPIENFSDAEFHEWIAENVSKSGYTKPTPVQKYSIPTLLGNRDLMSCAQTGSGKTAAFLLPIINHILSNAPNGMKAPCMNGSGRKTFYPSALVLSPTRELAIQIHKEAAKFSYRTNLVTSILYGGRENYRDQLNKLRAGCHILIATPGRLIDIIDQGYVGLEGCKYFVLDEADRMLDMGFEPQIRKIVGLNMPSKHNRTTAMFSATFPKEIQMLAKDFLKDDYVFLAVGRVGSTSENIEQRVMWVEDIDKRRNLMQILSDEDPSNLVLVFVETKRGANELSYFLNRQQVRAVAIHGDLKQIERERNLDLFRSGEFPVLVATAVAARGLDIPNVRHVINHDLPGDSDEYVHRIGRTGRCGNVGIATSFFNDKNRGIGRDLLSLIEEANQEIPDWLRRVASEGKGGPNNRYGNKRFGGVDHRRVNGYNNNNHFSNYSSNNGFEKNFNNGGMYGNNGPRRPFAQNGGFGSHNGFNGYRGNNGNSRGFPNGMNGFNSNDGTIDQWKAPSM